MDKSLAFWNRRAARYAAQPVADQAAYEEKLKRTRALFRPDMDLFEFGCGSGSTALIHAPYLRSVLAIDYSKEMVTIARAKAEKAGIGNITFETDAIESRDMPDTSFDVVLGMSILHLVSDRDAVIAKVFRLLKPGGFFVSSTACLAGMSAPVKWGVPLLGKLGLVPKVGLFSTADLVRSLETAGFSIRDVWQPDPGAAVFIIAEKP